nr:SMI1/KNR4 family protein [uncultured Pseudomonas sp.]
MVHRQTPFKQQKRSLAEDYYCFNYAVKGQTGEPVVVLWSHETGEIEQVAESFSAFLVMPGRSG